MGGALLVPTSLALLSVSSSPNKLGRAIGIWSGATSIASAAGPVLGGYLAQHASWRWVFFLNVPLAGAVLFILAWRVPVIAAIGDRHPVDWKGASLTMIGLGGVVFGFLQSSLAAGLVGCVALTVFVLVEWKETSPMLPLSLFKSLDFTGACLLTFFLYGALGGAFYFLPLDLVQVQGYSETGAGLALLPLILLVAGLSTSAGRLLNRFSAKLLLAVGPMLSAVGFAYLGFSGVGGSYWSSYFPAITVLGLGMALTVAPLTTTVMSSVGKDRSGIASGVNNAVARVAGLLTVAIFGLVLAAVFNTLLDHQLDAAGVPQTERSQIDRSKLAGAGLKGPEGVAVKASFAGGLQIVMLLASGLSALGAASSLLLLGRRKEKRPSQP